MPYITHPTGVETFYRDDDFTDPWKPKETILIQHGFGRSSALWYQWVPVLARKYRVIRRDALGHGLSSGPPLDGSRANTVDVIIAEMVDTLDQLGIDKVHLLCESTGGILGEFLAAKYPHRLQSLTICGSPVVLDEAAQKALAYGYESCEESIRKLGARGWGEAFVGLTATDKDAPEGFMDWYLEQFSKPEAEGLAAYAEVVCSEEADGHKVMHQIKVPMLLLTPANSNLVPVEDQKRLAAAVERSRLEIIPGNGHEIYFDQAELCQGKFLDFLNKLER